MRKKGLFIFVLTFVVTLVMGICVSVAEIKGQAEAAQSPFATTYELGQTLKIPSRTITVDGVSQECVAVVVCPDGSSVSSETIKLSDAGVYKVEYRALIGGKVYKENHQFTVDFPKYSVSAKSDSVSYQDVTVNGQTREGLLVKIGNGSVFNCNQVIDLNQMEKGENFISMFIVPEAVGAHDCTYFYLTLADALDDSNYIKIKIYRSPTDNAVIYASARAHNQENYYGVERGFETGEPITNDWGFAANGSFSGVGFGADSYAIQLSYDNDTQTLYMANNYYKSSGNYVIDFNNPSAFTEGWDGFKSGKIRISAEASSYAKNSMSFLVTSLAQVNLEKIALELTEPSGLTIDFGDYDETDYPHAVVGKPYRIFDATPLSLYTKERVTVSVKTSYGASNAMNVDVKDGKFIPQRAVKHTIVYAVTDGFGNVKEYTVPVTVESSYTPVSFSVNATEIKAGVGDWVEIPKITDMKGGNGQLTAQIVLKNKSTGATVAIENDRYRFVKQGNFALVYTVKDYNECAKTVEIPVTLTAADKPVFGEDPVLPLTYIKGAKYAVPTVYADDFSSGDQVRVLAKAKVFAGDKELTVTDGYFVAEGTNITIQYTATDSKNRQNTQNYSVSVTDVGFNGTLDLTKYFMAEGGEVTTVSKKVEGTTQKLVSLKATEQNAAFTFIRELNGRSFSTVFALESGKTDYEKIVFVLTDSEDESKYVEFALSNANGNIAVAINGGLAVSTGYKFGGDIKDSTAELNGNTLFICNEYLTVKTYADGKEFKGFDKYVYLTIRFENCYDDEAQLTIKNINKQGMDNAYGVDVTEPNVMFLGARCKGEKELNSIITIAPVLAVDVLDPYAKITFSVRLPSKDYATAEDGTLLKNVPADKEYQLKLTDYGSYSFNYTYTDSNDNEDDFTTVVSCLDKVPPVITVSVNEISGKVGKKLSIPECTVTDNHSRVSSFIQIITPDGIFLTYNKSNGYTPQKAGIYTVRYYVFDTNYNAQFKDIVCKVS